MATPSLIKRRRTTDRFHQGATCGSDRLVTTARFGDRVGTTRPAWWRTTRLGSHVLIAGIPCLTCADGYPDVLGVKGSQVQILSSRHSSEAISILSRWPL